MFNHFGTDGHFSEITSRWVTTYGTIGFVCKFLTVLCRDDDEGDPQMGHLMWAKFARVNLPSSIPPVIMACWKLQHF
jgi:hypothetical protein